MTAEELAKVVQIVENARPTEPRDADRDCYFIEEGRDHACDQIIEELTKEFGR